jgi:hypothetical protein
MPINAVKSCPLIFPSFFLPIPLSRHGLSDKTRRGEAVLQLKAIDVGEVEFVPWFALAVTCLPLL